MISALSSNILSRSTRPKVFDLFRHRQLLLCRWRRKLPGLLGRRYQRSIPRETHVKHRKACKDNISFKGLQHNWYMYNCNVIYILYAYIYLQHFTTVHILFLPLWSMTMKQSWRDKTCYSLPFNACGIVSNGLISMLIKTSLRCWLPGGSKAWSAYFMGWYFK